ncbi:MAG: hypothetical protein COV52_06880 [Gammaproteobacteria bacterium CG11_big_fil_rev_8_21_14_0_20_46_22]|nr:MAG: hypothetical protein COW05_02320 [Gammaproteobacteria bacterium CG12_big_fil_rev_8_21_14_0_65_46_12]PIR10764.1 MAG: hypothetical protein COV52_06880 [Gammaproteobacteria bacterium CG11_big_fil_rev_8_21_14_0_20_46_22]
MMSLSAFTKWLMRDDRDAKPRAKENKQTMPANAGAKRAAELPAAELPVAKPPVAELPVAELPPPYDRCRGLFFPAPPHKTPLIAIKKAMQNLSKMMLEKRGVELVEQQKKNVKTMVIGYLKGYTIGRYRIECYTTTNSDDIKNLSLTELVRLILSTDPKANRPLHPDDRRIMDEIKTLTEAIEGADAPSTAPSSL